MKWKTKQLIKSLAGPHAGALSELASRLGEKSWSQEGEDRVLWRYFDGKPNGFYVDVGAYHPFRFSNTYLFYRNGWRGINIDATPGSMRAFRRYRSKDTNLELGIAETSGYASFHIFNNPVFNTFDEQTAKKHDVFPWRIEAKHDVPVKPLRQVLYETCADDQKIDFLSVDVEGYDLNVLRSNDWERFRPKIVLAESLGHTSMELLEDPCANFMRSLDYVVYAKTINTVLYLAKS
jgi:FkbM family methyltransferase